MKSNYRSIGELVERIDERNIDGHITNLLGVSIDKKFISSVANTVGTDLTKYKIIRRNDFAVSLMQVSRDEKIPVACQKDYDEAIMSPAYPIFRIKDTSVIMPEYMEMWFKRTEFDREASYIAVGGVRGSMPWEEFAKMQLPIPDINEQERIVRNYKVIEERIKLKQKINDNLETALRTLYNGYLSIPKGEILPSGWEVAAFSKIATVVMGQSPDGEDCNSDGVGEALLNGPTEFGIYSPTPVQWTTNGKKHCENGDILFCVRGSTTGRMNWANQRYAIGRGLAAIRHVTDVNLNWFVKAVIENNLQEILSASTGSTFPNIGKDLLNGFKIVVPDALTLEKFGEKGNAVSRLISHNAMEVDHLLAMQKALLSRLSF